MIAWLIRQLKYFILQITSLQAGEIREINGWIVTTLNVLDRASGGNVKIGGVNEGWTYKVTVKMGDKILDEYSLLKDRSVP
jgi:hypothetical protein